jgi:hypothetical protein
MQEVHTHNNRENGDIIHRREYNRIWMERWRRAHGVKPNPIIAERIALKKMGIQKCPFCKNPKTLQHTCPELEIYLIIQKMKRDGYNSLNISTMLNIKLEEVNKHWLLIF